MRTDLENDLKRVLGIMSKEWLKQDNALDKATNFIYNVNSLDECLKKIDDTKADKNYALHRWYNYHTSIICEYIFCEFGAVHHDDKYNHEIDIYINGIPFDVKLTVYPDKLSHRPYDLKGRIGKNNMIEWFYKEQSQEGRKQLTNRMYVVCDAGSADKNMAMKSDFTIMREKIASYMEYVKTHPLNEVVITDKGIQHRVYSEIIYLQRD